MGHKTIDKLFLSFWLCLCLNRNVASLMEKKAIRRIFVGYDEQRIGWRCYDLTTGWCYTLRNVVFDEGSS